MNSSVIQCVFIIATYCRLLQHCRQHWTWYSTMTFNLNVIVEWHLNKTRRLNWNEAIGFWFPGKLDFQWNPINLSMYVNVMTCNYICHLTVPRNAMCNGAKYIRAAGPGTRDSSDAALAVYRCNSYDSIVNLLDWYNLVSSYCWIITSWTH